ncbi:MAG: 4-phosphoerythronate dehydrogenase [Prevotellaceae bacterium]|jgi:erythronate-4-phosphate dehydrogenase|nr:4-phosphoerythronate dehydrogenase [Prevotellaceae bacterium]
MKFVIDKDIPYIKGLLEPYGKVAYLSGKAITNSDLKDADALIVRTRTCCDRHLLENTKVKYIATATIGADHIDAEWCKKNGIKWSNAAGCNSSAVAQYTICSLLHLSIKYNINLKNRVLGIVGVGNIGSRVKKAAEALQMQVLLNDPPKAEKNETEKFVSIDEIAACADFISFHVPLTTTLPYPTESLADTDFFDALKRKPFLINTSRGEIINEPALIEAIKSKKISGAVIDVWRNEPAINRILLELTDIATFHIAGYSVRGKLNASMMSVNNVAGFFNIPEKFEPQISMQPSVSNLNITNDSFYAAINQAMNASYNILSDNELLKANPHLFEKLRSEYNYRYEPESYSASISPDSKQAEALSEALISLGFKINYHTL